LIDPRFRRTHAVVIAAALLAGLTALLLHRTAIAPEGRRPATLLPARIDRGTAPDSSPLPVVDRSGRAVAAGSSISASQRFGDLYPSQSRAGRVSGVPASNYWALLIGINDYAAGTRDNIGSYQDARDLRKHLLRLGWKGDHIVLLANRTATASMIQQSINWLASKTDGTSTVIFNYSGHEEPRHYGGTRHIMLHAADNRFIADTQIARALGAVRAAKMWINLAVCRAGGFNDAGLVKPGRVVTFSSPERELSYEDPRVRHSVFGWYVIMESMVYGYADLNEDGHVTAEEAFKYAKSRTTGRTSGLQHPFMIDKLSGNFYLTPPKPPAPAPQESSGGCLIGC
jgi:hypothetical protein